MLNNLSCLFVWKSELQCLLSVQWQDKKQRFYIVSAMADTKVDLKGIMLFLHWSLLFYLSYILWCWCRCVQSCLFKELSPKKLCFWKNKRNFEMPIHWWCCISALDLCSSVSEAWTGKRRSKNGSRRSTFRDSSGVFLFIYVLRCWYATSIIKLVLSFALSAQTPTEPLIAHSVP